MNRWLAFISVTALLLSGISIGALGVLLIHHHAPSGPLFGPTMPPPQMLLDHLDAKLGLSPEQRTRIAAILEESYGRSEEIRREVRPRLEKQMVETHHRIEEVLTPEQRQTFARLMRDQGRHVERLFLGEPPRMDEQGPPPPPPEP